MVQTKMSAKGDTHIALDDKYLPQFFQAAKSRNRDKLKECLDNGVNVNARENRGRNTAVHYLLCDGCFCAPCTEKVSQCLELLLHHGADPNLENGGLRSPLEFAVDHMVPEPLVKLIIQHGATVVTPQGMANRGLVKKLIRRMPQALCDILDKGVEFKADEPGEEEEVKTVTLNWRHLIYSPLALKEHIGTRRWKETEFLYDVATKGGKEAKSMIFKHPLTKAFLQLKTPPYWIYFGLFYFGWMTLTFLMYLIFIWSLYNGTCKYQEDPGTTSFPMRDSSSTSPFPLSGVGDGDEKGSTGCEFSDFETAIAFVIAVFFIFGPCGFELRKLWGLGLKNYAKQWQNYIFIPASILVAVTLWPAISMKQTYVLTWQYPSAAIGMLVGSVSIMIQMTPVPFVAVYLEILFRILLKILLAALAISPLFLGFFFSFRILLTKEHIGWFQLLSMIVSDNDYEDLMDNGRGTYYEIVAYFFFSGFIILMIVVVVNFLIGLAVSDVEELKSKGIEANLENKIKSFYIFDGVYGKGSNKYITSSGLEYQCQPLRAGGSSELFPTELRHEILDLARSCCCYHEMSNFATRALGVCEDSI